MDRFTVNKNQNVQFSKSAELVQIDKPSAEVEVSAATDSKMTISNTDNI